MPLKENMDDYEIEVSVIDVYDIASEIGKEFEKIIDCYGSDALTGLMPKVITALEQLEILASKNERENSNVQELQAKILKLESDKQEKAEDRIRYERDLESIEDHWKKETQELESVINTLQEENRKLKSALADKNEMPAQQFSTEVDIASIQRLRGYVDQLREQVRKNEQEILSKNSQIDELSGEVKILLNGKTELNRKLRVMQLHVHGLIDERTDQVCRMQDLEAYVSTLQEQLGEVKKDYSIFFKNCVPKSEDKKLKPDQSETTNLPRFTVDELKEILHERNDLKAKVSDLEDELETFRPKPEPESVSELKEEYPMKSLIDGSKMKKMCRAQSSPMLRAKPGWSSLKVKYLLPALGRRPNRSRTSAL